MRPLLLASALLLVATGCSQPAPEASPTGRSAEVTLSMDPCPAAGTATEAEAADVLPGLSFPCLTGEGELTLGQAPGVPTVLNLWAPWCSPCRDELPLFDQLHARAGEQVAVTGLVERDTRQSSVAFAADMGLSFPSALDETGQLVSKLGLNGLPVTFFLRADGSIAHRRIGPITSYDELRGLLGQYLGVQVPA